MIVRFIANMLDDVQRRGVRRQAEALTFRLEEQCLQTGLTIGPFCDAQQQRMVFIPADIKRFKYRFWPSCPFPPSIRITSGILLSSMALP
jgi:hypothetical protein